MSYPEHLKTRLLVCSESSAERAAIQEALSESGLEQALEVADTLSETIAQLRAQPFEVILLDFNLLTNSWRPTLEAIHSESPRAAIILIIDRDNKAVALEALQRGAEDYLLRENLQSESIEHAIVTAISRKTERSIALSSKREMAPPETQLERIFSKHSDAMLILGKNYEIRYLNPAAASLLEAEQASVIGEVFPFTVKDGEVSELEIPTSENTNHTVELTAFDLLWKGENTRLVSLRKITARRQLSECLERERARLSALLDSFPDGILVSGDGNRADRLNNHAAALLGVEKEAGKGQLLDELIRLHKPSHGNDRFSELQKERLLGAPGAARLIQLKLARTNGEPLPVTCLLHPIRDEATNQQGCVIILKPWKNAETSDTQTIDGEPMNSVSFLVGGIAHDFNNMLTAILGNLALARLSAEEDAAISEKLLAAEHAALQAQSLSQQLLTFSREGSLKLEQTSISKIIHECAQFILRGSNVKFEISEAGDLWHVDGDRGRIGQVMNNLIINADQAMPDGGSIEIVLRNLRVRRAEVPELDPGDYVCIEVRDSGTGIAPENLKRVFSPYFTTKENGNGLGLASSYSIVRSHRGTITADSALGHGSIFRVYLPKSRALPDETKQKTEDEEMKTKEHIQRGNGRVLLMDDMDAMLMVAGEILSMLGYEVETSRDGQEAVDSYKRAKEEGTPFDAVVFDLTVPGGMGGEEAANLLKEYDPDLVAIASSGYSNSNVMTDHKSSAFKAVVPKPYRIDEMSNALHSVLNER